MPSSPPTDSVQFSNGFISPLPNPLTDKKGSILNYSDKEIKSLKTQIESWKNYKSRSNSNKSKNELQKFWKNLFNEEYNSLRYYSYPGISDKEAEEIDFSGKKENTYIKVYSNSSWNYRCIKGDPINIIYYKTPAKSKEDWVGRHDPVTIYLTNQPMKKTLDELSNSIEPYIRKNDNALEGYIFANGSAALQKSPNDDDVLDILKRAEDIDPPLTLVLHSLFSYKGKFLVSSGDISAANNIINRLKNTDKKVLEACPLYG